MKDSIRWTVGGVLWTASAALMIVGTFWAREPVLEWGLYVAMAACLVIVWVIVDCATYRERVRVDRVVEQVVDRMQQERRLPRI